MDDNDGATHMAPMRSQSTPATYMSMDILRAEVETVSGVEAEMVVV